jgi:hypothetical protein
MTRMLRPTLLRNILPLRQIIKSTSAGISARGTFKTGLANVEFLRERTFKRMRRFVAAF